MASHNKVTTRYWAKVASVVPRDWTAKATRIAQAIEALIDELVCKFGLIVAGTYIKPAKKTNSKYILCGHEIRNLTTIGIGKASMMVSATRSKPPIAKVSLPYAKQFIVTVMSHSLFLTLQSQMTVEKATQ